MAENAVKDEDYVMVCPFYLNTRCPRGKRCEFAHEMTDILPENVMCEYHLRGVCKYGDKCWFSHGSPKPIPPVKEDPPGKIKMRFSFRRHRNNTVEHIPLTREVSEMISEMRQTYADIVKNSGSKVSSTDKLPMDMCIHFDVGKCPLGTICPCIHGNFCDLCQKYCLNPYNREQQKNHLQECEQEFIKNMEYSFAVQNSQDKVCGICLEVVLDKEKVKTRKFGILEKCNHVFCLSCIREWRRRGKNAVSEPDQVIDQRVMRACPQCRLQCDFITPSEFWFGSEEEKQKMIKKYKEALKSKDCKYFRKGSGKCPFGGHCFYRHVTLDGVVVELPPPVRRPRQNQDGEIEFLTQDFLWDFIVDRIMDENFQLLA